MKNNEGVWRLEYLEPIAPEEPDEHSALNDATEEFA
jgi:hypothetical protein